MALSVRPLCTWRHIRRLTLLTSAIWVVMCAPVHASPQYAGIMKCRLPGCSAGVTRWKIDSGTNRGYNVANATTGVALSATLIDDTDHTRRSDFLAACHHYSVVMVTIGQGEPASTHFSCPTPAEGIGLREWYPFWGGRLQIPYSWFPCASAGWVSQSTGWSWGGAGGDSGTGPPATARQAASEFSTLNRDCPVMARQLKYTSGIESTF